ncbi:MAG TPA: hypothetical protein VIV60_34960, partial [Polyangiaceae bacterium]
MRRPFLIPTIAICAFAIDAHADVLVAPVDGTNLEPSQIDSISQTLAAAYQVSQREPIVPMYRARQTISESRDL